MDFREKLDEGRKAILSAIVDQDLIDMQQESAISDAVKVEFEKIE